jgi:hypothetical protein
MSVYSIHPDDNCTTLRHDIEDVGSDCKSPNTKFCMYRPPTTCLQKCGLDANPALARIVCAFALEPGVNLTTMFVGVVKCSNIYGGIRFPEVKSQSGLTSSG